MTLAPGWQRSDLLADVLDRVSDGLFFYDTDCILTGINRLAERFLALQSARIVGKHCRDAFGCKLCAPECGILVGLKRPPRPPNCVVHLYRPDGNERIAVIGTDQLLDKDGRLQGVVATIRGVSQGAAERRYEVIAESPAMREVVQLVKRVAASEAMTILLQGDNGTGKDLIAKAIHYESPRQNRPFVALNCAAIPERLLESELFGYEKGAFTDARVQKEGLFEVANGGTLFLDEIGELPLILQAKLLHVVEDQTFRRLGGTKDIHLDLRVIAASNRNLSEAVREGAFRQDLYFRLNVINILIQPLHQRPEDILPLAHLFIRQYNRQFKRNIEGMTAEASDLLMKHDWPGNVRELRNAIERAMILEDTSIIQVSSLPLSISSPEPLIPFKTQDEPAAVENLSLEDNERFLIARALEKTNRNQTQAARLLCITRDTLRYRMKRFKLQ